MDELPTLEQAYDYFNVFVSDWSPDHLMKKHCCNCIEDELVAVKFDASRRISLRTKMRMEQPVPYESMPGVFSDCRTIIFEGERGMYFTGIPILPPDGGFMPIEELMEEYVGVDMGVVPTRSFSFENSRLDLYGRFGFVSYPIEGVPYPYKNQMFAMVSRWEGMLRGGHIRVIES